MPALPRRGAKPRPLVTFSSRADTSHPDLCSSQLTCWSPAPVLAPCFMLHEAPEDPMRRGAGSCLPSAQTLPGPHLTPWKGQSLTPLHTHTSFSPHPAVPTPWLPCCFLNTLGKFPAQGSAPAVLPGVLPQASARPALAPKR